MTFFFFDNSIFAKKKKMLKFRQILTTNVIILTSLFLTTRIQAKLVVTEIPLTQINTDFNQSIQLWIIKCFTLQYMKINRMFLSILDIYILSTKWSID